MGEGDPREKMSLGNAAPCCAKVARSGKSTRFLLAFYPLSRRSARRCSTRQALHPRSLLPTCPCGPPIDRSKETTQKIGRLERVRGEAEILPPEHPIVGMCRLGGAAQDGRRKRPGVYP